MLLCRLPVGLASLPKLMATSTSLQTSSVHKISCHLRLRCCWHVVGRSPSTMIIVSKYGYECTMDAGSYGDGRQTEFSTTQ